MNVILYMAITANGMIAKIDGNSNWVSAEDTESFLNVCIKAKVVIMGRHTYDVLAPNDLPLETGLQIVLTNDKHLENDNPTVIFTAKQPVEILHMIKEKGYQEVCIIGGSQTVSLFMQQGLIDEIYFDIEPFFFGRGMPIFRDVDFEYKLHLLDTRKLSKNTIQVHYKVIKNN